jgi:hypothetical protein
MLFLYSVQRDAAANCESLVRYISFGPVALARELFRCRPSVHEQGHRRQFVVFLRCRRRVPMVRATNHLAGRAGETFRNRRCPEI